MHEVLYYYTHSRGLHLAPHATVCLSFDSRQGASAFNQPLSWDTSSVTYMRTMFGVRSSPRAP